MTLTPEREAEIRAWAGTSADPLGVPPGVSGSLLCELLAEIDRLRGELTEASDRETQQAYVRDRLEQAIRDALDVPDNDYRDTVPSGQGIAYVTPRPRGSVLADTRAILRAALEEDE